MSEYLTIIPMHNLVISEDEPINGKWQVGDVTFHSTSSLDSLLQYSKEWVNKAFVDASHNPAITSISKQQYGSIDSYAVLTVDRNNENEARTDSFRQVFHESCILASTKAFYGKREQHFGFSIHGYPFHTHRTNFLFDLTNEKWSGDRKLDGGLHPFELDKAWYDNISQHKYCNLFLCITNTNIDANWCRQIASSAAMLGKSMMSLNLSDAFLYNIFGLETLLTRKGERNATALSRRIAGLTGWHLFKSNPNYEVEISRLMDIRHSIVHDADYGNLTQESLLLSDMYLKNCLLNVVRAISVPTIPLFPNKDALADILDDFANNKNWLASENPPPFQWFGDTQVNVQTNNLQMW